MSRMPDTRHRLLAKVHVAAKELGLDEETYRCVLRRVAGISSAAQADDDQLRAVLAAFRRQGWRPRRFRPSRKPHVRKVWALWGELVRRRLWRDRRRSSLRAFVKRQTGVDDPEWLTPREAEAVIEALKAIGARAGVDWEAVG